MQFKKVILFVAIWSVMATTSEATCWLSRSAKKIMEKDISLTTELEFSLHPTSGIIMAKQFRRKTQ
jgi:hypothetical protein